LGADEWLLLADERFGGARRAAGHAEFTGGEGGIRTLETLAGLTVFETAPFNRSGTSPLALLQEFAGVLQAERWALATECGPFPRLVSR
jgi:hypothetical protein